MWPNATAGTTVQGACIQANGFKGIAVRSCSATAVWGPITTPCTAIEAPCPAVLGYQSRTNWPSTPAGTTATGSCALGYTFGPAGAPTRECIGLGNGTWAVNVTNNCEVGTDTRRQFALQTGKFVLNLIVDCLMLCWWRDNSVGRQRQQPHHVGDVRVCHRQLDDAVVDGT